MTCLFVKSISICLLCFFSWAFSSSAFLLPRSNTCSNTSPRQRQRQRQRLKVFVATIGDIGETADENNLLDNDRNNNDDDYDQNDDDNDDDNDTKNMLTFQSTFQTKSEKLPQLSSSSDLMLGDFLIDPQNLLRAGESIQMKIVPTTTELLEEWIIACHRVSAAKPSPQSTPNSDNNDDAKCFIVSVRTAGISIPGLTVEWSALIGTNLIDIDSHYPELELVLIKDETNVSSGSRPIVWIFNRLMKLSEKNKKNTNKNNNKSIDTKLFTRLGFSSSGPNEDTDDDKESLVLRCNGTMEMKFRIPALIRKLAFSSSSKGGDDDEASHISKMERSENLMNNIITKYIEKDTKQHIIIWEESYLSWFNNTDIR